MTPSDLPAYARPMSNTPVTPPTPSPTPNPMPFTVGQRIRTRIALDAAEGETPVEVGTEGVITEIVPPIRWPILVALKGHAMARSFAPSELEPLPEPGLLTAVAPESEFVKTVTEPITAGLPDPLSARDNLVPPAPSKAPTGHEVGDALARHLHQALGHLPKIELKPSEANPYKPPSPPTISSPLLHPLPLLKTDFPTGTRLSLRRALELKTCVGKTVKFEAGHPGCLAYPAEAGQGVQAYLTGHSSRFDLPWSEIEILSPTEPPEPPHKLSIPNGTSIRFLRTVYTGGEPYALAGFTGTYIRPHGDRHMVTTRSAPAYPFTCEATDFEVVAKTEKGTPLDEPPEAAPKWDLPRASASPAFTLPSGDPVEGLSSTLVSGDDNVVLIQLRTTFDVSGIHPHMNALILRRMNDHPLEIHHKIDLRLWSTQSVTPNLHLLTFLR